MKRLGILKLLQIPIMLGTLPTIFMSSSCGNKYQIQEEGKIDGTDWHGVNAGSFLYTDYQIDYKNKTITYISGLGIHAYNLTIPNYVKYNNDKFKVYLGEKCFANCVGISGSVQLNSFISDIPDRCFCRCTSLTSIIFLQKPKYIGNLSFADCPLLSSILILEGQSLSIDAFSDVRAIGNFAFSGCITLSGDVVFGSPLSHLGEFCFNNCIGLSSVNFKFSPQITMIEKGAFSACNGLTHLYLSSNIQTIKDEAFKGCALLESIDLASNGSELTLGTNTFYGCSRLTGFTKNVKLKEIGASCFSFDGNLTQRFWEKNFSLDYVPKNAFSSCNLTYLKILPDGSKDFGDYCFSFNNNLSYLDFSTFDVNDVPDWTGRHIFAEAAQKGTILLGKTTIIKPEWKTFFEENDIIIDDQHWKIQTQD